MTTIVWAWITSFPLGREQGKVADGAGLLGKCTKLVERAQRREGSIDIAEELRDEGAPQAIHRGDIMALSAYRGELDQIATSKTGENTGMSVPR
jgi:hypothetical protein